jgi:hypothetical protein
MLVPLSHVETSAESVHVKSCPQVPGPEVVPEPHLLFVHVCPLGQVPQLIAPPQPSASAPQVAPCAEHVVGVQLPEHATTGLAVGVGQSFQANPAALVKWAANWAHPLSQVDVQQYACAGSAHTSWTQ